MFFDDPEGGLDVHSPHPIDRTNHLRALRGEVDHNLGTTLPHMDMRRPMFSRRQVNDDTKAAKPKNGWHGDNNLSDGLSQRVLFATANLEGLAHKAASNSGEVNQSGAAVREFVSCCRPSAFSSLE